MDVEKRTCESFSTTNIYAVIKAQEKAKHYIRDYLAKVDTDKATTALIFFEMEDTDTPYLYRGYIQSDTLVLKDMINEELDTASAQMVDEGVLTHLIPNNTKAIIIPELSKNITIDDDLTNVFTFDSKGRPLNHRQYVVSGGAFNYKKGVYIHQYGFVEPTALLRAAYTGTNSDTNMTATSYSYVDDSGTIQTKNYTKDANNLLTMLTRQLKITGLKTQLEDTTWYSRITIESESQTLLQNNGIGASESFNSATLYDTTFKFGKYIKRHPVLYFDKDFTKEFLLVYEPYDGSDKETINYSTISSLIDSMQVVNGTNRQSSHVACEAENIFIPKYTLYPKEGKYLGITGDEGAISYEVSDAENMTVHVPYPIQDCDYIIVRGGAFVHGTLASFTYTPVFYDDKKIPCVQYEQFILLDADVREQTAYYKQGENKIYVSHLKGFDAYSIDRGVFGLDEAFACFGFRVHYQPILNDRIEKGNYNALTDVFNQTDSNLDNELFGTYLEEYSKESKNYDVSFTMPFDSFSSIYDVGTLINYDDVKLIISSATIQCKKTSFFVSYVCNTNMPKRSELIDADKSIEKTFVDSSKAFNRFINLRKKYTFKLSKSALNLLNAKYICNLGLLLPVPNKTSKSLVGMLTTYSDNVVKISSSGTESKNTTFYTPINAYSCGKSLILSFNAYSSKVFDMYGGFARLDYEAFSVELSGNQTCINYSDIFGLVNTFNLVIYDYNGSSVENSLNSSYQAYLNLPVTSTDTETVLANYLSQLMTNENSQTSYSSSNLTLMAACNSVEVYKDTNEILNLAYQLDFEGDNITLGDGFFECNPTIYDSTNQSVTMKNLTDNTSVSISYSVGSAYATLTFGSALVSGKEYAVYMNDKVLFSFTCDDELAGNTTLYLGVE